MLFCQIRPEFTSELRLRAHLFAAHFACLNQEADKASAGIGFALDHYQKAALAPIFLSKQMFFSELHAPNVRGYFQGEKKIERFCANVLGSREQLASVPKFSQESSTAGRGLLWLFWRAAPSFTWYI